MSEHAPYFSIIIPTRNEAGDILETLKAIQGNTERDYEVLVVDASGDRTPELVRGFGDPRFRLLSQDNRDGRCGARNQGIRAARGEVVVILNADVLLPLDFLSRLRKHYDRGADYVIVDAVVENAQHPFGAMVEAEHRLLYHSGREKVDWCEGYSCRRRCALEAGLFPEKLPVAICAGEDAVFGENMARRFRHAYDPQLVVRHRVPEDLAIFWSQRIGRGEGCVQRRMLIDGWPFHRILLDSLKWTVKSTGWILLLFPMLEYARALHRQLPSIRMRVFLRPIFLSRLGHEIGRWQGILRLRRLPSSVQLFRPHSGIPVGSPPEGISHAKPCRAGRGITRGD